MTDRQDIDALIVGAVYGELDDADRVRLDAHLSSHPEDRATLESLERTRAQVRRGLAELPAAEPPASLSATLLQAAARRAPARGAHGKPGEIGQPGQEDGVFARFLAWLRPVALNPAFAGAAILLLVAGTFLVTRDSRDAAEPTLEAEPARTEPPAEATESAAAPAAATGGAPAPVMAEEEAANDDVAVPAADGDFAVGLDEGRAEGKADKGGAAPSTRRDRAKPSPAPKKKAPSKDVGYLEVAPQRDAVTIKEMDGEAYKQELGLAEDRSATRKASVAQDARATAGAAAPAAPPPPPRAAEPESKPMDPELEAWAKQQHRKLLDLVAAKKCGRAGEVGAELKYRAPEYYAANVANDRGIRQCKQYIENQAKKKAEKEFKSRSQSNTIDSTEAEAPADTRK